MYYSMRAPVALCGLKLPLADRVRALRRSEHLTCTGIIDYSERSGKYTKNEEYSAKLAGMD